MYWNTLKIVTVIAVLASPSAIAAIPGTGALDGRAGAAESPSPLQIADHRGGSNRDSDSRPNNRQLRWLHGNSHYGHRDQRPHYRDQRPHYRDQRPHYRDQRPRYRGHPPHHYREHRPRHFRGRPIRRFFRHWRRHH